MSELPAADPSSSSPRSLGQRTAALLIDLTLLAAIVYVGRVIALSVALYIDDLARHLLLGLSWSASLDELRVQLHSHPLLLGRPALVVCSLTISARPPCSRSISPFYKEFAERRQSRHNAAPLRRRLETNHGRLGKHTR